MNIKRNIIFLYAEITPYLEGCLVNYTKNNIDTRITIIQLNNLKTSSYKPKYNSIDRLKYINVSHFESYEKLKSFVIDFDPTLLVVSGRMSRYYLKIAKHLKGKINVVTVQDSIFEYSFRHLLRVIFSFFLYKRYFDFFWGTGSLQTAFALSMGFDKSKIFENFYVSSLKSVQIKLNFESKTIFLFTVARLSKVKNLVLFSKVIEKIINLEKFKIKFIIYGEGELHNELKKFDFIELRGFKSHILIEKEIKSFHAFCLPSIYEPWGVVVHEFASKGFPILASNECGSSFNLLVNGYNGFKFSPNNTDDIYNSVLNFCRSSIKEKLRMSSNSVKISKKINHSIWNSTLNTLIDKKIN